MRLINLLSYAGLPDGDPDDLSISALLAERGIEIAVRDWRTLELKQSDKANDDTLYILRSTWDYDSHYDEFMAFVDRVPQLINTAATVKWNADKSYLRHFDMAAPSLFIDRHLLDDYNRFGLAIREKGWKELIVKPCVGLSTHGVKRFADGDSDRALYSAWEHAHYLAQTAPVMVQRFIESVETYRERSLVFIDGEFTHSVSKTAFQSLAPAGGAGEKAEVASEAEIDFAQRVMQRFLDLGVGPCPVYARVDIVQSDDESNEDGYYLLELELIEPSLFLAYSAKARQRLVDALSRKLDELSTRAIRD